MGWHAFDYQNPEATAPKIDELVWIHETHYFGVTVGYFDGDTFCHFSGSTDVFVSHWRPMDAPNAPKLYAPERRKDSLRKVIDITTRDIL